MKNIITTTLLSIVLLSCGGEKKEDKSTGNADAAGVVQAPQKESTDNQPNSPTTDGMSDCDKFLNEYIDYCQKLVAASKKSAANLETKLITMRQCPI